MKNSKSIAPRPLIVLVGLGLLGACRAAEPHAVVVPVSADPVPFEAASAVECTSPTFAYLLEHYDANGDAVITAAEYTRHDGQLARWDTNRDGRVTEEDWAADDPRINPQIELMQRMDVLGRYFQTDENELEVLTIDELANAFFEYDAAGTPDEELTEAEFRALADERAIEMPGDGSMMMQSYVGEADGWYRLTEFYDDNRDQTLNLAELAAAFENVDAYELRFDQVRFDDGAAGAHFERLAYEAGLVVGSAVPDVTLTSPTGDATVNLASIAGRKPIALIFGSYT